jgi:hypothetical protein
LQKVSTSGFKIRNLVARLLSHVDFHVESLDRVYKTDTHLRFLEEKGVVQRPVLGTTIIFSARSAGPEIH